jgi:hypothetical protein
VSDDEKGGLASFSDSQTGSLIAAAKAAATAVALVVTLRVGSET